MSQWVIQVHFSLEGTPGSNEFIELAQNATLTIKKQCPELKWMGGFFTFGEYDLLLIVECADPVQVQRAAMVFRGQGHTVSPVMCAIPWEDFLHKI